MTNNSLFNSKGLHILHLNIRSLFCKNKYDMFKQQMVNSKCDIICLSETWFKQGLSSNYVHIPNYNLIRLDLAWTEGGLLKKGGGVCAYLSDTIKYSDCELSNLNKSTIDIEIQWVTIKGQFQKEIIIANVYRPPQGNFKKFLKYMDECIDSIENLYKKDLFILGDFNIDVSKKNESKTKDLLQNFNSYGLKQYINGTTRYGRNNSCIDLIFSNSEYVSAAGILDLNFSDHQVVYMTRKKLKPSNEKIKFTGRSYRNRDIMERIIDKDKALAKAKKTGNSDDWNIAKFLRNETGKLIETVKKQFFEDEYLASKGNPKRFWRNIYNIIPKRKNKSEVIHLKHDDTVEIPQNETSNYINEFFTNIGPELAKNYNKEWKYYGSELNEVINDIDINEGKVFDLVKNIDISKSSGFDNISSKCLKDALSELIPHLTYIFRKSILTGICPDSWKIATVVPIFKNGNKSDVSNYRPISLLPVPGKLLEKIVYDHISDFLEQNSFLSKKQNGFRKNHSTLDAVVNLTSDIYDSINKGKYTLAAFIDLKKAFDTVNHKILLEKLWYAGVKNSTLNWINNYLINRFQRTICNSTISGISSVTCGVPQG